MSNIDGKRKVWHSFDAELDGVTLADLPEFIKKHSIPPEATFSDYCDDGVCLEWSAMETDKAYEARVNAANKRIARSVQRERNEYERLKLKYESRKI